MLALSLQQAIKNDELVAYYQPQFDCTSQAMVGVKAMVQWQHTYWGTMSSLALTPVAESTGLILEIDQWLIETACQQLKKWQEAGVFLNLTVNISSIFFNQCDLIEKTQQALQKANLDPQYLTFSLTEKLFLNNLETSLLKMSQLKKIGINLCLDEFGKSYSSLSHLLKLPFDSLVIERCFLSHWQADFKEATLISAIIYFAHRLNIKVVAEGIQTESQLQFLQENNCDVIQGYGLNPPLPAQILEKNLFIKQSLSHFKRVTIAA
jgi:diguanylate cyclase